MKHKTLLLNSVAALAFGLASLCHGADLLERLSPGKSKSTNSPPVAQMGSALSPEQMIGGLKEALAKGVQHAITNLGRSGGFLNDLGVRIPMPENLQKIDKAVRALGQGQLADDFVTTMNRAAEQAVPEAASVLGDAIRQMTVADAKAVLTGTNNAATEYFRRTSTTNLQARFLPIVKKATEQAGVTKAYKLMTDKVNLGGLRGLGALGDRISGQDALDVDAYVTRKALDGLFVKIAEQEKMIRENPVARTTDLLQKVFGAVSK
jgi:hypothetical protein